MATIRAKYEKGVLTPLEPLDLEEGKEVVVSVESAPVSDKTADSKSLDAADDASAYSAGLLGLVERIEKLRESYPLDLWEGGPPDSAKNFKHYLYGHPRGCGVLTSHKGRHRELTPHIPTSAT